MRKSFIVLLAALCILCLFGCDTGNTAVPTEPEVPTAAPTEPPTEPATETLPAPTEPEPTEPVLDTTKLYNIDVTGMTEAEAKEAIQAAIDDYTLTVTVNRKSVTFSGSDLSMTLNEDTFAQWFADAIAGSNPAPTGLIDYQLDSALSTFRDLLEQAPVNATVAYSQASNQFEIQAHQEGVSADMAPVRSALIDAITTLSPANSATVETEPVPAEITDEEPRLPGVAASANSYLDLNISYTYQAEGIPTTTKSITTEQLASFISVKEDLSIALDSAAVQKYISSMNNQTGGVQKRGFITSYGTTISQVVEYYTVVLDETAMYHDLMSCLESKTSSTNRPAPFLSVDEINKPYGGNYVEIDLDNQCLWVYKNGNLVIKSPLVSGNVSHGNWTPPGVFTIYGKTMYTYLTGPTWRSWVDYWMPFNGGIGMHDANWRSSFGDTIYMYDGSHGCINLPPKNAAIVYENVSIGTKVIVYGGARTAGSLTQEFTCNDSYTVSADAAPFSLDVKVKYTGPTLTYVSSDSSVVTVDETGVVTIVGPGSATITVTSSKLGSLKEGKFTITVTVENEPEPTEPEPTEPETTDPETTEPESTEPVPTETLPAEELD